VRCVRVATLTIPKSQLHPFPTILIQLFRYGCMRMYFVGLISEETEGGSTINLLSLFCNLPPFKLSIQATKNRTKQPASQIFYPVYWPSSFIPVYQFAEKGTIDGIEDSKQAHVNDSAVASVSLYLHSYCSPCSCRFFFFHYSMPSLQQNQASPSFYKKLCVFCPTCCTTMSRYDERLFGYVWALLDPLATGHYSQSTSIYRHQKDHYIFSYHPY
jgi:hypothetical protein